jgi:hypothetical protein
MLSIVICFVLIMHVHGHIHFHLYSLIDVQVIFYSCYPPFNRFLQLVINFYCQYVLIFYCLF